jgi:hypothetical protein
MIMPEQEVPIFYYYPSKKYSSRDTIPLMKSIPAIYICTYVELCPCVWYIFNALLFILMEKT